MSLLDQLKMSWEAGKAYGEKKKRERQGGKDVGDQKDGYLPPESE